MKQRQATHGEMTARVKARVREIVHAKEALRNKWRNGDVSREVFLLQCAKMDGQMAGMRELLSYALWGELE